jgi:hypothetical protein
LLSNKKNKRSVRDRTKRRRGKKWMRINKSRKKGLKTSTRKNKKKLKNIDLLKFKGRKMLFSKKKFEGSNRMNSKNRLMIFWPRSRKL